MTQENYYATGRRKSAIAKTWIKAGTGQVTVNGRKIDDYFTFETAKTITMQPLVLTNNQDSIDVVVSVIGGGITGQAGAIRHGITRALIGHGSGSSPGP